AVWRNAERLHARCCDPLRPLTIVPFSATQLVITGGYLSLNWRCIISGNVSTDACVCKTSATDKRGERWSIPMLQVFITGQSLCWGSSLIRLREWAEASA